MKRTKVAILFICLNENYWPYLKQVIDDCFSFFLTDHRAKCDLDFFVWTDIPKEDTPEYLKRLQVLHPDSTFKDFTLDDRRATGQWWSREVIEDTVNFIRNTKEINIIPTEPVQWPMPTLLRYHLFLQKEEELKNYDYLFYMDADMRVVAPVGREILGDGLTMAEHPMYSLQPRYTIPYEPNRDSTAYIPRPGVILKNNQGQPFFKTLYAAGGFQGGKSKDFIQAMKSLKKMIDRDMNNNYIARWNDESYWNRYLFDNPPAVILSPSYVYPDSLIKDYYEPIWGTPYQPKILTITKPFSLSKEGGQAVAKFLGTQNQNPPFVCPQCGDTFAPEHKVIGIKTCGGKGKAHQVEQKV